MTKRLNRSYVRRTARFKKLAEGLLQLVLQMESNIAGAETAEDFIDLRKMKDWIAEDVKEYLYKRIQQVHPRGYGAVTMLVDQDRREHLERMEQWRQSNNESASAKGVIDRTTLSKSSIYRMMDAGSFPLCFQISPARVAWDEKDIDSWLAERIGSQVQRGSRPYPNVLFPILGPQK